MSGVQLAAGIDVAVQLAAGIDVASRLPQAGSLDVAVHLVGIRFPGETPFPAGLPASMPALP